MKSPEILDALFVEKLIFWGKGLATAPDGRKVIISGGAIPGSTIRARILKSKKSHYEAQELEVIMRSPIEVPLIPPHQLYGGAKWLTINYDDQLRIKEWQVRESFHHLSEYVTDTYWHPIVRSPEIYSYRNKVEFSWGKYISAKEGIHDDFRFGFHAQGQFDRIIDCTYCALADEETNSIFRLIDDLSRASELDTYDPKTGVGFWRHLVVRKMKNTGQCMLIFSVNQEMPDGIPVKTAHIFTDIVQELTEKYKSIRSVILLENTGRADIVTGIPHLLFGTEMIEEELLWLTFDIRPKSFFQVNTLWAELLYEKAMSFLKSPGGTLLDLYAGTGTIGILLASRFQEVYSVELVPDASRDGAANADKNGIKNVHFICGKAEDFARSFLEWGGKADTIIIDPPRDGMHPSTLPSLLGYRAREIIYVSCNPATLARDLEVLIGKNRDEKTMNAPTYRITDIAPVDMFPHTHHIETVVRLERSV